MLNGLFKRFKKRKVPLKISFLGLDRAGKTTIINWLKGKGFTDPDRTLGMTVATGEEIEGFSLKGLELTVWDIGGQVSFRNILWEQYSANSDALVYIIDANDKQRYAEAISELYRAVSLSKKTPLLYIIMNKLDLVEDVLIPVEEEGRVSEERLVRKGDSFAIIDKNLIENYLDDILWELNLGADLPKHVQGVQIFGVSAKTKLGLNEAFQDLFQKLSNFRAKIKETTEPLQYVAPMRSHLLHVQNIYIVNEGGIPVLSAEIGSITSDSLLVGGLLGAMTEATKNVFGSSASQMFPMGAYTVYNRKYGLVRVFVVADRGTHKRALERVVHLAYETAVELGLDIHSQKAVVGIDIQPEFEKKMREYLVLEE
ncbi:MAG: ADP-ribosylation factor-like protein [Candidatus Hodarchaeales archaeon]